MGNFYVTSPQGQRFKITAPDTATEEEIISFAQQNMPEPSAAQVVQNDVLSSVKQSAQSGVKNIAQLGSTEPTYEAETPMGKFLANASRPFRPVYGAIELATAPATAVINAAIAKPVERMTGSETAGAIAGLGASLFAPKAIRNVQQSVANRIANANVPITPTPSADDVKDTASALYKAADQKGGVLLKRVTNRFIDQASRVLPQTTAGRIVAGKDTPAAQVVERLQGLKNRELSLREAQEIDELLGDAIDGFVENGVVKKEGQKLLQIQQTFRDTIEKAPPIDIRGGKGAFDTWKAARGEWARSAKLRDIEKIVTRAQMMQQPATAMKTGFRNLYNNPKKMRGFSPEERKAIKRAAEGEFTDILSNLGSRLTSLIGLGSGNPGIALAAGVGSNIARRGAEGLQLKRAQEAADLIAKGPQPQITGQVPAAIRARPLPRGMAPLIGLTGLENYQ